MSTPTLDQFLGEVASLLQSRNGEELGKYLIIEPPLPEIYQKVVRELRTSFLGSSQANASVDKGLDQKLSALLPRYNEDTNTSGSCTSVDTFLAGYLRFIRDVEQQDVATIFQGFRELMKQLSTAMGDYFVGSVLLQTAVAYCSMLSKFTRQLEKSPELTRPLLFREAKERGDGGNPPSLTTLAVESMRPILQKCTPTPIQDGRTGLDKQGRPEGNRIAIYAIANICFPLCLKTGDLNSLEVLIGLVEMRSPRLSAYPIAQRVTYLYFLGRYWFAYSHFVRAQTAFDAAYMHTPARFQNQRTRILTYLLATNVILGRLPSQKLLQRPEAASLVSHFGPLCQAISQGNLPKFRSLLDLSSTNSSDAVTAHWFLRRKLLVPLRFRCEVYMSRTIFRRLFIMDGYLGDDPTRQAAPNFDLKTVRAVIVQLEKRAVLLSPSSALALAYNQGSDDEGYDEGYYQNNDHPDNDQDQPSLEEVEATAASLIYQDLLRGYIVRKHMKVAIAGAKGKNAVLVGFPPPWPITRRGDDGISVPGWKR